MRPALSTLLRTTVPALAGRSMTTSLSLLSRTSNKNLLVRKGGSSAPKVAAMPWPKVYNSDIRGSGSDPRSQLTATQNKEVDEHNRHFTKQRAREERANDKGGRRY